MAVKNRLKINYNGVRWKMFSQLAAELNPDLSEILVSRSRRKDPAWRDLQSAMHQPFLDPLAQAVADMTGSDFRVVRSTVLRSVRELSERRFGVSRRLMIEGMLDIDPHLASWFVVHELEGACRAILDDPAMVEAVSSLRFPALYAVSAASAYAQQLLRTFSMSPSAARSEVASLASRAGLTAYGPSAMERLREFRDTIMPRSELVELGEASPIRRSLASLVAMSISALSTVWDLDNDLVDQMQSWKETAQRPSRTYSIGMVTKMSMDDEVDALSLSMTSAIYAAGNNGAKLGLSNSSLRHALDLIEAYPPTPVADAS
jgi:hypothetical protein